MPLLSDIPFVGPVLFGQDPLIYVSFLALAGVTWFLYRTHPGLILRSVGDSHNAAHAIGYPVIRIRYAATAFGGAMAGLAGGYMSLSYSPLWAEDMTAGRGWIALALVVFAAWRPLRLLAGAYLFGGIMYLSLYVQGVGIPIPSPLVSTSALYRHCRGAGDHFAGSSAYPAQSAEQSWEVVPCYGVRACGCGAAGSPHQAA